ncbi:diadenylate cyclase CdaA [Diplocloster modestus]|uniref:Diadenylate cyclase n=1 Tax=Diplocloster modestus TaxID=2850322 RepID=A0ABS6K2E9_9FIRM|nr:diadenylate cyclase CdaA [Diplocloster modestus]MBU9724559.1 diadenylate cyclase CdaA [Diplocloster modestus]
MSTLANYFSQYMTDLKPLNLKLTDFVEVLILAFLIYEILVWIKNTRAWILLKGFILLMLFILMALIFRMDTILFIVGKSVNAGIIALVVIFQPELRKALEQLGQKNVIANIVSFDSNKEPSERFSDRTINEVVKACFEMGKVKTGALIVIAMDIPLTEYERTGIVVDSAISSQLILNIFEHNTPLHDGAVIMCGDRITAATCYLPLSDNMELSKELGTRHRAAIGISEVTDSFTIVVSEETGAVSIAQGGRLWRNVDQDVLKKRLVEIQGKEAEARRFRLWKGRHRDERKAGQ